MNYLNLAAIFYLALSMPLLVTVFVRYLQYEKREERLWKLFGEETYEHGTISSNGNETVIKRNIEKVRYSPPPYKYLFSIAVILALQSLFILILFL